MASMVNPKLPSSVVAMMRDRCCVCIKHFAFTIRVKIEKKINDLQGHSNRNKMRHEGGEKGHLQEEEWDESLLVEVLAEGVGPCDHNYIAIIV